MAIAQDASTPTGAQQTNSATSALTTASFTAPAGAVLLASWQGNSQTANPTDPTISDSGGLTWTLVGLRDSGTGNSGQAALWRAVTSSSAARTVTVNNLATSGNRQARLKVLVLTGVDTTNPVVASGTGSDSLGALDNLTVTTGADNSWVVASVSDWDVNSTTFTAAAGTTIADSGSPGSAVNGATLRNTTPGASGSSVSLGLTSPTSTNWNYVWAELRPATLSDANPTPSTVAAVAAVAVPAISRATTATPGVTNAGASVPTPTIQASVNVTPSTVAAAATVLAPSVSAGGGTNTTFFGTGTPTLTGSQTDSPVTLGLAFVVTNQGQTSSQIAGIRHYAGAAETGTPIGLLYDSAGTELARANFATNPGTGWLECTFSSPVTVTADGATVYVAAVYHPQAEYSFTSAFYTGVIDSGALHTAETTPFDNGRFTYGGAAAYPSSQSSGVNYWVDVNLLTSGSSTSDTATPSTVTAVAAVPAPTVTTSSGATATPSPVAAIAAVKAPTVTAGGTNATATPGTVQATAAIVALTASIASSVTPDAVAGIASVKSASVAAGGNTTAAPAKVTAVAAVPAPTIHTGSTTTPGVVTAAASVKTPSVTASASSTPWFLWDGVSEVPLTLSGVWNGASIDSLTFDEVTA